MYFPSQMFTKAANRMVRITLSIVVIGIANTAAADNLLARLLPSSFIKQSSFGSAAKPATPAVVKGELVYVICSDEGGARVRDSDMKTVLYNANPLETLKLFQGWTESKKTGEVDGQQISFVRVQFDSTDGRSTNIGWVAEKFIKLKSQCPAAVEAAKSQGTDTQVTGLTANKCCRFPITHIPLKSYLNDERKFGASRSKGRIHAASDLYGKYNEPILAVAPGKVIRGLYEFYNSTYALDVKHQGGFIVRYGEISGKRTNTSSSGASVRMGQRIAHMGQLVPRVRDPMLHFELYRGNLNGPLNVGQSKKNGFGRRKDLIDPTQHLQRWEKAAF